MTDDGGEPEEEREREDEKGGKGNRIRPRERYRMLIDILDEMQVLIAMGDRKARFALMILAAFNAAMIVGGTMSFRFSLTLPTGVWLAGMAAFLAYGLTAIYFFVLAIDSLRPRKAKVAPAGTSAGDAKAPGIRFYADIIRRGNDEYWETVRGMDYELMNRELSNQVYGMANLIRAKYDALAHLYAGMRILTLGAAGLLVAAAGSGTAVYLFYE